LVAVIQAFNGAPVWVPFVWGVIALIVGFVGQQLGRRAPLSWFMAKATTTSEAEGGQKCRKCETSREYRPNYRDSLGDATRKKLSRHADTKDVGEFVDNAEHVAEVLDKVRWYARWLNRAGFSLALVDRAVVVGLD
jgi:hypothetical protein